MPKGKIIFLNGVTSAGKSSITREMQELADVMYGMLLEMREYMQEYGNLHYDLMQSILSDVDIFLVEVFCPLEECRRRNIARGDRGEYQSEEQNKEMNKNVRYDFRVDTSANSAKECARQILKFVVERP